MTTVAAPRVLKIWRDTVRADICKSKKCRRRIWWAKLCKSDKWMCFSQAPEPIQIETEAETGRELLTVDASTVHWADCAGRQQFKSKR